MNREVVVVIGAGGIGQAIGRHQGSGRTVLLADLNEAVLAAGAEALAAAGHDITTHRVDVSSRDSVRTLADAAAAIGNVTQVVHTAGLSPVQAPVEAILAVDLFGVAVVLDEFARVIAPGGAGVVISSMAGYMQAPLEAAQEQALAHTHPEELLQLPFIAADAVPSSADAYALAKRANHLRVQAACVEWGDGGARVNSISPGIILTPLAKEELASEGGPIYQAMIQASAAGRMGTTDEIATAAAFLLGPDSNFITGADILIDGGVIAALRVGRVQLQH